jgi:hypothetical protein
MRVIDAAGRHLDASYAVEAEGPQLALIMESRGGGGTRDGRPGRNADYNNALEVLLERLGWLDATLLDALVDSRNTQWLGIPEEGRRLIAPPVRLADVPSVHELRLDMGRRQQRVAQEPNAPKGGNATKRIRLILSVPGYRPDQADQLAGVLAMPMQERGAPGTVLDKLEAADQEEPTGEDFAAAVSALDALDKTAQTARRVEQSYLRRALFSGPVAACDLCGRDFEVEFLVAAHIKKRAVCSDSERRDVAHVVMSACRFGCDELFERGYISVDADGRLILSGAVEASEQARGYARQHLAGRIFGRPMTGRESYFAWHHANTFR